MFYKDKFRASVDRHYADLDVLLPQHHGKCMACADSIVGICNKSLTLDYWKQINIKTAEYESVVALGSWLEADLLDEADD